MATIENSKDIQQTLELCEQIEQCNAEIYNHFAKLFADSPDMAALWHKTALEEENHAQQFTLALKLQNLKVVENVTIDRIKADAVLSHVKSIYDNVLAGNPSKLQALTAALKLEEKLAEFHANAVAVFVDESYRNLFTAMMKADKGHVETLQKAYKKLTANSAV